MPRYSTTFFRLIGFLRGYKLTLVLSILLAFGAQAGTLAFPWLTGNIVQAIQDHHRSRLPLLIGMLKQASWRAATDPGPTAAAKIA